VERLWNDLLTQAAVAQPAAIVPKADSQDLIAPPEMETDATKPIPPNAEPSAAAPSVDKRSPGGEVEGGTLGERTPVRRIAPVAGAAAVVAGLAGAKSQQSPDARPDQTSESSARQFFNIAARILRRLKKWFRGS